MGNFRYTSLASISQHFSSELTHVAAVLTQCAVFRNPSHCFPRSRNLLARSSERSLGRRANLCDVSEGNWSGGKEDRANFLRRFPGPVPARAAPLRFLSASLAFLSFFSIFFSGGGLRSPSFLDPNHPTRKIGFSIVNFVDSFRVHLDPHFASSPAVP